MRHKPEDEGENMRRIRLINEPMYDEILELESVIQIRAHEKMIEIKQAKDLLLEYDVKGARQVLNKLKKK